MKIINILSMALLFSAPLAAQQREVIHLWPGAVPGEQRSKHAAVVTPDTSWGVKRLTDVTDPLLEVYPAPAGKGNGGAVVVCPGGGYNLLAINLEGYEIAEWLNGLGYTAFVLQYRVPQQQAGALQDLQRALRVVRSQAVRWQVQPERVGVLGFSAGGSLAARASTRYRETLYAAVDKADEQSAKPAYAVLIYPAYLDKGPSNTLTPEIQPDAETPPIFLFGTSDDSHGNSIPVMAAALRLAKSPVEAHLYATGRHGYGLRPGNPAAAVWPGLAATWLKNK
ncbi:alpha/beta hydrolase [Chitinophaga pendula]|uniref:alpha/beta hydrolase n=1 Tax=Chitinophaga TaxID=79328 RepID=UPI000BAFF5A9|nr:MULTISPECIES: alpha/beta hydrolase [Chitinophaga]ASZ12770.1 xylanase [Chitinophaga sp. MD30]UCJ09610.1 alpha/beta hydrolase [Chitinophaga pendula]